MSWENFQEDAFNLTKSETKKLTQQVIDNYRRSIIYINKELKDVYAKFLTGINPDNYYDEMLKRKRLEGLLKRIQIEYSKYSQSVGQVIRNTLSLSFSNVYYRKLYAANWITKKDVFKTLPRALNELAVFGTSEAWKNITKSIKSTYGNMVNYVPQRGTLSSLLLNNKTKELNNIRSTIVQNLINGGSYTDATKSVREIIGQEFKDGKVTKFTGAKSNAIRIIRTEGNRILNAGSYASSKNLEANGIDVKRRVLAILDVRTRAQSRFTERHNKNIGVDEPIQYPNGVTAMFPGTTGVKGYDINDRETVIDIIDDIEPQARIGRNPITGKNEYFEYKDFDKWAEDNNLTKNVYGEYIGK